MTASRIRAALLAATANLVVCGAVGTTLLLTSGRDDQASAAPPPAPASQDVLSGSPYPTSLTQETTSSPASSADYDPVSTPDGLSTVVPHGWLPAQLKDAPGSYQATDPADASHYVRYGVSPAQGDIFSYRETAEADTTRRHPGLARVQMTSTTLRGNSAVDWEFTLPSAAGPRHVRAIYWRTGNSEYFVYVSSLSSAWEPMPAILSAMTEQARP